MAAASPTRDTSAIPALVIGTESPSLKPGGTNVRVTRGSDVASSSSPLTSEDAS